MAHSAGPERVLEVDDPGRIAENFDFELSADEIAAVDALDRAVRNGPDPDGDSSRFDARAIPGD